MTVEMYFLLFMIYSFIGWNMEVVCKLFSNHKFINRGFLIGPYCPIYGFGFLIMSLLLSRFLDKPLLFFVMAVVVCTIFEYLSSYIMEKLFHARWWDYSNLPLNINGRVYIVNMIVFGVLAVLIFYFLNPFIVSLLDKINPNTLNIISIILFIIIVTDFVISFLIINNFSSTIKTTKCDNTEEITKYVRQTFMKKSYFFRRLVKAFPDFQTKVRIKFEEVRDKLINDEE